MYFSNIDKNRTCNDNEKNSWDKLTLFKLTSSYTILTKFDCKYNYLFQLSTIIRHQKRYKIKIMISI